MFEHSRVLRSAGFDPLIVSFVRTVKLFRPHGSTVDVDGLLGSTRIRLVAALFAFLIVGAPAVAFLPVEVNVILLGTIGLLLLVWATGKGESDDGETDTWHAIPSWQYTGRHAETGGIAREEQERSIRQAREKVEILDDVPDDPDQRN